MLACFARVFARADTRTHLLVINRICSHLIGIAGGFSWVRYVYFGLSLQLHLFLLVNSKHILCSFFLLYCNVPLVLVFFLPWILLLLLYECKVSVLCPLFSLKVVSLSRAHSHTYTFRKVANANGPLFVFVCHFLLKWLSHSCAIFIYLNKC